jgi:hypothetical protein
LAASFQFGDDGQLLLDFAFALRDVAPSGFSLILPDMHGTLWALRVTGAMTMPYCSLWDRWRTLVSPTFPFSHPPFYLPPSEKVAELSSVACERVDRLGELTRVMIVKVATQHEMARRTLRARP